MLKDNELFEANDSQTEGIKELAESIVLAEARIDELKKETTAKRSELITLMQQTGQTAVTLDSGLSPKLEIKQRFSRKKQISQDQVFSWLRDNGLEGIIRPAVHAGTLQTTLEEFSSQGGAVPEAIFNSYEQPTIRMNGKTKFLNANRH